MYLAGIAAGTAVLLIEVVLLVFVCSAGDVRDRSSSRRVRISVWVAVHVALAILLSFGAYTEQRAPWFNRIRRLVERSQGTAPIDSPGDGLGLRSLVTSQLPQAGPPNLRSKTELLGWQGQVRKQLQELFRFDPEARMRPAVSRLSETHLPEGLTRLEIAFQTFDDAWLTGLVFFPTGPGPFPCVLAIHGHVGAAEDGVTQIGEDEQSYQRGAARALARAGILSMTFALRGLGRSGGAQHVEHRLVAYNALLAGTFYKAVLCRDIQVALEVLAGFDQADTARLGLLGVSFGGELAVTYAALSPRINAVSFHAYGGTVGPRPPARGANPAYEHGCHLVPGVNEILSDEDWLTLLAPRPTLGVRGSRETTDPTEAREAVQEAWLTLGVGSHFEFIQEPGGHELFLGPTLRFFREHFGRDDEHYER